MIIFRKITLIFRGDTLCSRHITKTNLQNRLNFCINQKYFFFFFSFLLWNFFVPGVRSSIFVVSVHYSYLGVPYSQFWALKHNLGMAYTGRSTTFKKRAIARAWAKNVPYVCTYIKIFQEVRQLCLKYTHHKYLVNWTIRKKDTAF